MFVIATITNKLLKDVDRMNIVKYIPNIPNPNENIPIYEYLWLTKQVLLLNSKKICAGINKNTPTPLQNDF